ncbi:hypothetical protein L7F22_018721 [Adiantum nelumboides]|nr:hypothetical protein [Adiantum nelumboides]
MFWRMAGLSTTSPVESLLDRDGFTLEELLDEDELIQECKSLNTRLINFLRGKIQIEQLVKYVIEEAPEGADNKRAFKFPFIACEIFTCEIEVIMKTMVEDEELMELLFSFLEPDRPHGTLLAGYFSKVVICLLLRKTAAVMRYLQMAKFPGFAAHQSFGLLSETVMGDSPPCFKILTKDLRGVDGGPAVLSWWWPVVVWRRYESEVLGIVTSL